MIAPLYDRDGIRLYQSTAQEVLLQWREPIACVISDPPYHLRRYLIALEAGEERRATEIDGAWFLRLSDWYLSWLSLLQPLVADGPVWIFAGLPWAGVLTRAFAVLDWPIQDLFGVPGSEIVIYAGRHPLSAEDRYAVHAALTTSGHCAIKPMTLLSELIRASHLPAGSIICDPFSGDGSTLTAAKAAGMRALGIEYREDRCQVAINALNP